MSAPQTPAQPEWLAAGGPAGDIVLSSRVRLARNLAGFPFPNKAGPEDRRQILALFEHQVTHGGLAPCLRWVDLSLTPALGRGALAERQLMSRQHAKGDSPRALAYSAPDERLSVMVLEEDHLRLQVMRRGLALAEARAQVNEADDRIEAVLDYAFHPRFGYLTACPTNVGTGIRVSVMLHLPGLKLTGEIDKVRRAAKSMNLAVRGFYGEGSEPQGDFCQLSNQTTLGRSEEDILNDFEGHVLPQVIEYERLARRTLVEKRRVILEDRVFRAYSTLRSARLLKTEEALELLSLTRLGVLTGLLSCVELSTVQQLVLLVQPAHLQQALGIELDQSARRIERATLVRRTLGA